MGRKLVSLLLLIVMVVSFLPVSAAVGVTVCRDGSQDALRFIFSGIDWNSDPAPWYVANGGSAQGDTFLADAMVDGEYAGSAAFGYWTGDDYRIVIGNAKTRLCQPIRGDAPSITVVLTTDCAFVEISNGDGGWSRVESDGEPVLLHYGESLIAGRSQSLEPADYRAVPTACF